MLTTRLVQKRETKCFGERDINNHEACSRAFGALSRLFYLSTSPFHSFIQACNSKYKNNLITSPHFVICHQSNLPNNLVETQQERTKGSQSRFQFSFGPVVQQFLELIRGKGAIRQLVDTVSFKRFTGQQDGSYWISRQLKINTSQ